MDKIKNLKIYEDSLPTEEEIEEFNGYKTNKKRSRLFGAITAFALAAALTLTGQFHYKKREENIKNISLSKVIEAYTDESFQSDIIQRKSYDDNIRSLEKHLYISELLEKEKVNEYKVELSNVEPVTDDELTNFEEDYAKFIEIREKADKLKTKDKSERLETEIELYRAYKMMQIYSETSNGFIARNGYEIAANIGINIVKEAYGNALDQPSLCIENFEIPPRLKTSQECYIIDTRENKDSHYNVPGGIYIDLIRDIYNCQEQIDKEKVIEYKEDRNAMISKLLNDAKIAVVTDIYATEKDENTLEFSKTIGESKAKKILSNNYLLK